MNRMLTLGDSLEVLIDHRGKTPRKMGSDFTDTGVPVASAILVKNGRLDLAGARHVDTEVFERWMITKAQRGDVLLTSEAPLGRVARVPSHEPLVLGQRLYGLRGKPGVLDTGFLYYALQSAEVQADLRGRATGTTVFGIRQSALRSVPIPAPDYAQQQAIAEVLGALDDKIAANDRANRIADQLCSVLVERASAAGTRRALRDVLRLQYGKALPASRREEGCVRVYGSGGEVGRHNRELVDRAGVVVGRKGTAGAVYWAEGPHWPIDTTYYVEPRPGHTSEVLYYVLRTVPLADLNSDSAVPGLNREQAYAQVALVPDGNELPELSTTISEALALVGGRNAESRTLATTRDELLPLLLSGKVRVKDAERRAEEVL